MKVTRHKKYWCGFCTLVGAGFFSSSFRCIFCHLYQVFSLVTFICATVWHDFVPLGGGWVQFVSMIAFILTTFLYMLYMFQLTSKLSEQIPFKFTVSAHYC